MAEVSKIGNLEERLVVVNHGWQSKSTDGPKGGWSCVFWNGCNGHLQLLDVVWCNAAVVVLVVWQSCSCGVLQLVQYSCNCMCGGAMSVMQCNVM